MKGEGGRESSVRAWREFENGVSPEEWKMILEYSSFYLEIDLKNLYVQNQKFGIQLEGMKCAEN